MTRGRHRGGAGEAARRRHSWLELVQISGPFLTLPVVHRVFPDGLPPISSDRRGALRGMVARMLDDAGRTRRAVIDEVLSELLDWSEHRCDEMPDSLVALVTEHRTTVRAHFAFAVTADVDRWRLLGRIESWGTHPLTRTTCDGWTASAVERLAVLLRAHDVPVGLITDGRWWALVWAPRGGTTGTAVWDASLFGEEPDSLAAFAALLDRHRFLGVAAENTLARMLTESVERHEELTTALGRQIRDAVELVIRTFDRLDERTAGRLLAGVNDDDLYHGVVIVMMRLVFLLYTEERRLLPSDGEVYAAGYSIGRLVDDLSRAASLAGEQALGHRNGAWHRLLATTRAVYDGVHHEDLRLPAYRGSLFDPDRFPWLEGRRGDESVHGVVLPLIDDRTVLHMLEAVQFVTVDGERRRLTFRSLGVEQIGYVYEGLLDVEVRTADELTFLLHRHPRWPRQKSAAEVGVSETRTWIERIPETVESEIADRTGWAASRVETALAEAGDERIVAEQVGDAEPEAFKAAVTLAPVMRRDERGHPMIIRPGRRFLALSRRRAVTGAHYTPPGLATEIVTGALEPLVYFPGPLETAHRAAWELRPSDAILDLRVADIAMGSGAFLVAACKYLADRLVDAEADEGDLAAERWISTHAQADADESEVVLHARRRVVEKCIHGVDVNPLAVDLAKLSLWLLTMDTQRPLDHLELSLREGDSLIGLVDQEQLTTLHMDAAVGSALRENELPFTEDWRLLLKQSAHVRRRARSRPPEGWRDIERKQRQLREARGLTEHLRAVADRITGIGLRVAGRPSREVHNAFVALGLEMASGTGDDATNLQARAQSDLQAGRSADQAPRNPLQWPIEFPEVFVDRADPGFDAIVGNPPFLGGQKFRGALGPDVAAFLQRWDGGEIKGSADLAARFVLRAQRLLSSRGQLGYIATNTLVQGDTLEVGLAQAVKRGLTIRRARSSHPWPSASANLEIVDLWASRAHVEVRGERTLDGEPVPAIGTDLAPVGRVTGPKHRLRENDGVAFIGSYVLGLGFTLSEDQARQLIAEDPRNADALQPYVIGRDLNQRPDCSASRWIINFRDWPLDRAARYPDLLDIVHREVKPERDRNNRKNYREQWWKYGEHRPGLYSSIAELDRVLAIARVSSSVMPALTLNNSVFSEKCVVFSDSSFGQLAIISSSAHSAWTVRYTSTMRTDINYSPSDVFLTLPRPPSTPTLEELGEQLDTERRELMLSRDWGLTTTYNHVHDPADHDPAVVALRDLHTEIDYAVLSAYGWSDLALDVSHHPTKIGIRWTIGPAARVELLDRLLEENHRRYAAEQDG